MESYGIIDSFFVDDPDKINSDYREYLHGLRDNRDTGYLIPNPLGECRLVNEFHNFISECWFLEYRTNLFTDSPLGAFIYEAVRNKAIKEKDISLLIQITNVAKTREVIFPGRRTTEDSVFVK